MSPEISVILCTWNRAALLEGGLAALVDQRGAPPHEVVVVDNGSPDATGVAIARYANAHPHLRYVREPQPGLAHARNAGVARARAPLLAFTDDDVRVPRDWVAQIRSAFARWPEAACVGGPVLPDWPAPAPRWLTPGHWAPLGVQDYGGEPFRVDDARPVCLIGANLAVRRAALERAGAFSPAVQRVGEGGGSTEDHEMHLRLWRCGLHGVYDPKLQVRAVVSPDRLSKSHHRAWHFGHGRHVARMQVPAMESTHIGRVCGVPAHLLRQAAADACALAAALARGDTTRAFDREARLWFAAGFIRERIRPRVDAN